MLQQPIGFHTKIVIAVAGYGQPGCCKDYIICCRRRNQFQGIPEADGVEDRFEVVEAIASFVQDIQSEVYFTIGENNHLE